MMKDTEFCERYLEQINGPFAGINLTRINTPEEFHAKQYVDSVSPFEELDSLKEIYDNTKIHVDIGFGGGFPLLPLASLNPSKKYIGFEARGKKSKVVNEIATAIGLDNVKTYHQRFENVYFDRDCTITFKAVSTIEKLLPLLMTDKKITVIFYKGPNFYELEDLDWLGKQWDILEESIVEVPGTEGRMMIALRNKNVLRGTDIRDCKKNKNKSLVTLSSFL